MPDGRSSLEIEIKAFFDAYGDTFAKKPAIAATFYSEPCITARSGVVRAHASHADLAALFAELDKQYRDRGYTHTDYVSFDWQSLGVNGGLATLRWAYKDPEERAIWHTTYSYNLYKRDGAWKILMQTMHDA
ncbi:MAG TPA: hypothetical protein VJR58_11395 [Vineibacter sp.]|nr:hypothetical protein [Vineibacter sp.]